MDNRLEKALEFCNYRLTLNHQLQTLKLKSENSLIFAKNGGSFNINENLISFLSLLQLKKIKEVVLLDLNKNPIKIEDVDDFLEEIMSVYFEVTNDYLNEYNRLRKSRNVKSVIELDE